MVNKILDKHSWLGYAERVGLISGIVYYEKRKSSFRNKVGSLNFNT